MLISSRSACVKQFEGRAGIPKYHHQDISTALKRASQRPGHGRGRCRRCFPGPKKCFFARKRISGPRGVFFCEDNVFSRRREWYLLDELKRIPDRFSRLRGERWLEGLRGVVAAAQASDVLRDAEELVLRGRPLRRCLGQGSAWFGF